MKKKYRITPVVLGNRDKAFLIEYKVLLFYWEWLRGEGCYGKILCKTQEEAEDIIKHLTQ